jgi:hypothetical protein
VRRLVQKILVATLFAVAILGGGELPILHAQQFAEAHAFVHTHAHGDVSQDAHADHAQATVLSFSGSDYDHRTPTDSDRGCTHVHAHCCGAAAILIAVSALSPGADYSQLRMGPDGAIPYGQLSRPLLRPPRTIA